MLTVLMTAEYELFANGRGCSKRHLLEPTERMLALLTDFGAKLTIHAEVGEIMRFKQHRDATGRDDFHFEAIADQLRRALCTGHDVQLHLHASYFGASLSDGYWRQDYDAHDLALLPYQRQVEMIRQAKDFLESMLRPTAPDYRCTVFRASNWSMQPTSSISRALRANGITIDSSVWKHGLFGYPVRFDYRGALSDLIPWPMDPDQVCNMDPDSALFEVPIYSEAQPIWRFLSSHRVARAIDRRFNRNWKDPELAAHIAATKPHNDTAGTAEQHRPGPIGRLFARHPFKMDFNQCTGRQLAAGLLRAERRYAEYRLDLPFVVFGHSRTFTRANARSLRPFLRLVEAHPDRFRFGRFADLDLEGYRQFWKDRGSHSVAAS